MSTRECLLNFKNTLKYFAEKTSLLGDGPLFPKSSGKQNNDELYLCLIEEMQQLLSLKLERAFCKLTNSSKSSIMSIDISLYEDYCAPLKSIMKLSVKNSSCSAILSIISSVIR